MVLVLLMGERKIWTVGGKSLANMYLKWDAFHCTLITTLVLAMTATIWPLFKSRCYSCAVRLSFVDQVRDNKHLLNIYYLFFITNFFLSTFSSFSFLFVFFSDALFRNFYTYNLQLLSLTNLVQKLKVFFNSELRSCSKIWKALNTYNF